MKLPRQLVMGQYSGKVEHEALAERAISRREMLAGVTLLVLFVSVDRFGLIAGGLDLRFELIIGGLLAIWFFVRSRGAVLQRLGVIEYALAGWLLANVLSSVVFSPSPADSLKNATVIAGMLSIYLVGLMLFTSTQFIKWAAVVWVAVGAIVAVLGLVSAFLYTLFGWTGGVNLERAYNNGIFVLTPRVQSTVWEPNIFGSYSMTVALLALALMLSPEFRTARRQWWLRAAVACAFCGMMISMTRTIWVLGPLLLAVTILLSVRLKLASVRQAMRGMLLPAAVGIVIGLAVGNYFIPTLQWRRGEPWDLTYQQVEQAVPYLIKGQAPPPDIANPSTGTTDNQGGVPPTTNQEQGTGSGTTGGTPADTGVSSGSTLLDKLAGLLSPGSSASVQGRLSIFSNTIEGWQQRPILGWGTGSYPLLYPPDYTKAYWIANLELHILFDTGLVGLVLFAIPVVLSARRGLRALRMPVAEWRTAHFILLGLVIAGAGLLVAYQVTDATWVGFTWVFFAMLVMSTRLLPQAGAPIPDHAEADARQQ